MKLGATPAISLNLWGGCADGSLVTGKDAVQGLTDEQKEVVLRPFPGKESSLVVQAYAGTGKTHTLHAFASARPKEKIHYLAFNKSMAGEAKSKFKGMRNVKVSTLHSLAYQEVGKQFKDRLGDIPLTLTVPILSKYMPHAPLYRSGSVLKRWFEDFLSSGSKGVRSYFDRNLHSRHLQALSDQSIEGDALAEAVEVLWKNVIKGDGICGPLPMPHNGYLKLYQILERQMSSKFVLIDEAQDVTDCMIRIVSQQEAHKLFIGDSFQQIYGWNGAVDSLRKLERAGAPSLYLTKSFRCPDPVAVIANRYLDLLGAVKPFQGNGKQDFGKGQPCILARSNAALFKEAWNCVSNGQKPGFLGGFEGYNFNILIDLQHAFYGKFDKVTDPWLREEFNSFDEILEYAEEADPQLLSRCNIVKHYRSKVKTMLFRIQKEQSRCLEEADVILSTTHKAKGAEWSEVYLCDDFVNIGDLNEKAATSESPVTMQREDLNIMYVAVTRAKGKLDILQAQDISDADVRSFKENLKKGRIVLL